MVAETLMGPMSCTPILSIKVSVKKIIKGVAYEKVTVRLNDALVLAV